LETTILIFVFRSWSFLASTYKWETPAIHLSVPDISFNRMSSKVMFLRVVTGVEYQKPLEVLIGMQTWFHGCGMGLRDMHFVYFWDRFHYAAQVGLKLMILLPQSPECLVYRSVPPYLVGPFRFSVFGSTGVWTQSLSAFKLGRQARYHLSHSASLWLVFSNKDSKCFLLH
jgi:hypothetical protein